MFGFLNIYKPKGKTSHDVVAILRKITKIKSIGHTGTLDPFAEGVLPICIGKTTKLIEYLKDDKAYIGTIKLGASTDTYDSEGEVVKYSEKLVNLEEIESVLPKFRGNIEQIPPIYSAIKVNGKKLYEYARKGLDVEIKPRAVTINQLDILNYDQNEKELELKIECSKGTYIRSIANDIGEILGTYGHLNKLIRIKAGDFRIKNSVKLENIQSIEDVEKNLINPIDYLHFNCYEVTKREYNLISTGTPIESNIEEGITILTEKNKIIAVGTSKNGLIKPQKVFI